MGTVWEKHDIYRVLQKVLSSKSTMQMDKLTSCLLSGKVTSEDMPSVTSRLIRVFLCSTAVDTCTERNAFVQNVYPKLREYSRQRYDLEFQMVDLAWGLTNEQLTSDPDFLALKLEQIDRCQSTSCGPFFLAFIGQNYGPCLLPSPILATDYDLVRSAVINDRGRDTRNADVIDQFYVIDDNSVPPVYLFNPEAAAAADENKSTRGDTRDGYEDIQAELHYLLQKGALLAFQDNSAKEKFFVSDLEREVQLALGHCQDPGAQCLLILRDIVDLKNYVHDPKAPTFLQLILTPPQESVEADRVDSQDSISPVRSSEVFKPESSAAVVASESELPLPRVQRRETMLVKSAQFSMNSGSHHSADYARFLSRSSMAGLACPPEVPEEPRATAGPNAAGQQVDLEAEEHLKNLRTRLEELVPESNTLRHEVLWRYEEVISPSLHKEYLKTLCEETYDVLQRLIDDCSQHLEPLPILAQEPQECLQHWTRCLSLTRDLCTCHPAMHHLREYVKGETSYPLILCGECGCGKAKMVSALANEWTTLVTGRGMCAIRYVGLTVDSGHVLPLLRGLCSQVCLTLGLSPQAVPRDWHHLQSFFPRFFSALPTNITVIVIIVGIEKLLDDPEAKLSKWLPSLLPSNVKFILTFAPDLCMEDNGKDSVEDVFTDYQRSALEMAPLSLRDAEHLLNHFLASVNRRISEEQMEIFKRRFQTCSSPLYVKLLALLARTLHSFSFMYDFFLPRDTTEAIHHFLDRLELKHGRVVVSRALMYMAASQSGLSDVEMEDLLSLDDDVLEHLYPREEDRCRVPCAVWPKIRRELDPFLLVQQADGLTVTVWEYECFLRAVRLRYMQRPEEVTAVHSLMADYYLGTWAGKEKAVGTPQLSESGCIWTNSEAIKTDRLVPAQPQMLFYREEGMEDVDGLPLHPSPTNQGCNLSVVTIPARLNRRLYHQLPRHLHLAGRQQELNELMLFNYMWIYNKIQGYSIARCLDDFRLSPGPETDLVRTALQEATKVIEDDLNNLAAELSGRLLPYRSAYPWIRTLVHSCDLQGLQHCTLLPSFPYHKTTGSPQVATLECGFVPSSLILVHNGLFLLCKNSQRPEVLVWDVRCGQAKDCIYTSLGELYVTNNVKYFVILDREMDKSLKIHEADTGKFTGHIIPEKDMGQQQLTGPLCLTDNRLYIVVNVANSTTLCVYQIPSGRQHHRVPLSGPSSVCQLSNNEQFVMLSASKALLVYDTEKMSLLKTIGLAAKPHFFSLTGNSDLGVIVFLPDWLQLLYRSSNASVKTISVPTEKKLKGEVIRAVRVASDDQRVLVRSDNHVLVYLITLTSPQECENARPHDSGDGTYTVRMEAEFGRPLEVPAEFRLPGRHYQDLVFTTAEFSANNDCVLATIFRQLYVWRIADHSLLTTLQTPIGITSTVLVSRPTLQLLTHNKGSSDVIVWRHRTRAPETRCLKRDRLSRPVKRVLVTADQTLAFAQCEDSDEIGVFDMHSGLLVDLLTHACKVKDMAITPAGEAILVITETLLSGTACHLWFLPKREVIKEWGDSASYCLTLDATNSLVLFTQPLPPNFLSPYTITLLHFVAGEEIYTEEVYQDACDYVFARPVATKDGRFLVISSASSWDVGQGQPESPCLMVFDCHRNMSDCSYDSTSMGAEDMLDSILQVEASPQHCSTVVLLISVKDTDDTTTISEGDPAAAATASLPVKKERMGLIMLDLSAGEVTSTLFFMVNSPSSTLLFSQDFRRCLDQNSTIYDFSQQTCLEDSLPHPGTAPQCLALHGTVVVYFQGSWLYVLRLVDAHVTARCRLHHPICHVTLCEDQRTLLIGCLDGKLTSYVIVDPVLDSKPSEVIASIPSRQDVQDAIPCERLRLWDKVQEETAPAYSRPPSCTSSSVNKEKKALNSVEPLLRARHTESLLKPTSCKCVRKNELGRWEKVKEVKIGFQKR